MRNSEFQISFESSFSDGNQATSASLRADFTIVGEFEVKRERFKSGHPLNLFCSRDKLYPPSLLYKDQSRTVFDFSKVLFSLTWHMIGWN